MSIKKATSLTDIVEGAKNKEWDEMTLAMRTVSELLEYGNVDETNLFGTEDAPVSLELSDIKEIKKCERCDHSNRITLDDVPKQLHFMSDFANGMKSVRSLIDKYGVQIQKGDDSAKWIFRGIGSPKTYK